MPIDKVRIGVIGTGGMGSGHCAHMNEIEEAQLTCICDIDPRVAEEVSGKYKVPGFTDPKKLLDSRLVDAVIIATPHYYHPPIAIEAFKRRIHVLSEKPIAVTVSAADKMIAAAEKSGCVFGVMYQMRTQGRLQLARQIIAEGRIGEIYRTSMIVGWYRSQAYYDSGGWRATWVGEGGGVLINQAPHFLDLYTWLGGLPVKLRGETRTRLHDIEVEDEAFAVLEYANGAHGYLYASTTEEPGHEQIEICGDLGKVMILGPTLRVWQNKQSIKEHSKSATAMWGSPGSEELSLEIPPGNGTHTEITRNFCRAILYGEPLIAPGAEGLRAVELINAVILSGHTGKEVTLPVNRRKYDRLLNELKKQSAGKKTVRAIRETDPHYVK